MRHTFLFKHLSIAYVTNVIKNLPNINQTFLSICNSYYMVPSTTWAIFSEFLIFADLFHHPLGE